MVSVSDSLDVTNVFGRSESLASHILRDPAGLLGPIFGPLSEKCVGF